MFQTSQTKLMIGCLLNEHKIPPLDMSNERKINLCNEWLVMALELFTVGLGVIMKVGVSELGIQSGTVGKLLGSWV